MRCAQSRIGGAASVCSSSSLTKLFDALFDVPVITIPRARGLLGVTHRAASLNVDKLVDLGILREFRHGHGPRLFVAPEIMAAVEDSARKSIDLPSYSRT